MTWHDGQLRCGARRGGGKWMDEGDGVGEIKPLKMNVGQSKPQLLNEKTTDTDDEDIASSEASLLMR